MMVLTADIKFRCDRCRSERVINIPLRLLSVQGRDFYAVPPIEPKCTSAECNTGYGDREDVD